MSFKIPQLIKSSFLLFALCLQLGCGEFLNNKKQVNQVIEFKAQKFECIDLLPEQAKKLSNGELSKEEIHALFDCSSQAIQYFKEKTFGKHQNAYTPAEIRNFFGKFLLKENNFSADFSSQVMKLKQILIGGSDQLVTKDELEEVLQILVILKDEATVLSPHLPLLLAQNPMPTNWKEITQATDQLKKSLVRLVVKTQLTKTDFTFEEVKNIVHAFADFKGQNITQRRASRLESLLNDSEYLFKVLMGDKSHFQTKKDWTRGISTLTSIFDLYLKGYHLKIEFNLNSRNNNQNLYSLAQNAITIINNSPMMVKRGSLPLDKIDELIKNLLPKYSKNVRVVSAIKIYKIILMRMLDPDRQTDIRALEGLRSVHLHSLSREINLWYLTQKFIDGISFDQKGLVRISEVKKYFEKYQPTQFLTADIQDNALEQEAIVRSLGDFKALLSKEFPTVFSENGRLQIHPHFGQTVVGWQGLSRANQMLFLTRFLLLGYAQLTDSDSVAQAKLSQQSLTRWYSDFNEIGLDLKAFDPRSGNSGNRSFLEAKYFMVSGNGVGEMSFQETYEFVSVLFASGLGSSKKIYDHMMSQNCGLTSRDIFGYRKVSEACLQAYLKTFAAQYFNNMPRLSSYLQEIGEQEWRVLFGHLFRSSVVVGQVRGEAELANLRTFVTLMHYIESVYSVYDADKNSRLSQQELEVAADRFLPFFRTLRPDMSETVLRQVFLYLIHNGRVPTAYELTKFQYSRMRGLPEIGRLEIARLMGVLKLELDKQ